MKRFLTILILFILFIIPFQLKAEETPEDMSPFKITILLEHCDQSDEIKIVRLRNKVTGIDAFCLEPHVDYRPSVNVYYKQPEFDKTLYDLYHAYELLERSDEAFITIQLMIWEMYCQETFTFNGKGASDYMKAEVLEFLEDDQQIVTDVIDDEAYVGIEKKIQIDDLDRYSIRSDVRIIESDENSITHVVDEYTDQTLKIELEPLSPVPKGAYVYESQTSQNIYAFEGEYGYLKPKTVNIDVLDNDLSISFSKLDLIDQPIAGAQFTLYRIDPQSEDNIYFLKTGENIDLYEKLLDNYMESDRNRLSINVSERYEKYIENGFIKAEETGYFPFEISYDGQIIKQGRIYVSDDTADDFSKINVELIKTVESTDEIINTVNGLKPDSRYYFCESEPRKGYIYVDEPCRLIDTGDDSYLENHVFYNDSRSYTLQLIKNNPEKTIALNGALFRLSYYDNEILKEFVFRTGALNIFKEGEYRYLIYRLEGTDDPHIVEFTSDTYIEENVPYGNYEYYLSNENSVEPTRFNKVAVVKEGSFIIENIPYSSNLKLEELEAPKGYYIDEAVFEIDADIPYSDITFTNSRVNSFDIIPRNVRKIPKTCIGD